MFSNASHAETWNQLENGAYSVKSKLEDEESDLSQKMSDEQKTEVMIASEEALEWIEQNKETEEGVKVGIAELKIALEKFEKVTKPILESCGAGGVKLDNDDEEEEKVGYEKSGFDPYGEDDWEEELDDEFDDIVFEDEGHNEL